MAEQSEATAHDRASTRPTEPTLPSGDPGPDDQASVASPVTFGYAPGAPVAGNPVLFEADVPGHTPDAEYEWTFGDGATATGEKASNVYDAAGEHAVTLTVTDDGETRTVERRVTVYREVEIEVGYGDEDADTDDGLLSVTLHGTDEFDPAGAVAVESLRAGAPTAVAAGGGAAPVQSEARDGDLRIWVRADDAGLRDDSTVRLAGHTTDGVPVAGTADSR